MAAIMSESGATVAAGETYRAALLKQVDGAGKHLLGCAPTYKVTGFRYQEAAIQLHWSWSLRYRIDRTITAGRLHSDDNVSYHGSRNAAEEAARALGVTAVDSESWRQKLLSQLESGACWGFGESARNVGWLARRCRAEEHCDNCGGRGKVSCGQCGGDGSTSCYGCSGSGSVQRSYQESYTVNGHIHYRTVTRNENCGSCYGNGNITCSGCGGGGTLRCTPCEGSGLLTVSYRVEILARSERQISQSGLDDGFGLAKGVVTSAVANDPVASALPGQLTGLQVDTADKGQLRFHAVGRLPVANAELTCRARVKHIVSAMGRGAEVLSYDTLFDTDAEQRIKGFLSAPGDREQGRQAGELRFMQLILGGIGARKSADANQLAPWPNALSAGFIEKVRRALATLKHDLNARARRRFWMRTVLFPILFLPLFFALDTLVHAMLPSLHWFAPSVPDLLEWVAGRGTPLLLSALISFESKQLGLVAVTYLASVAMTGLFIPMRFGRRTWLWAIPFMPVWLGMFARVIYPALEAATKAGEAVRAPGSLVAAQWQTALQSATLDWKIVLGVAVWTGFCFAVSRALRKRGREIGELGNPLFNAALKQVREGP